MAQTRGEEIEAAMVKEMASLGIDDTTDNRLAFLTGMLEGWMEDPSTSLEKTHYLIALQVLISRYRIRSTLLTP